MKKYILFFVPIVANMAISVICFLGDSFGGWLEYGGAFSIQLIFNVIVLPTYMVIIMYKHIHRWKNSIHILILSYIIMKIGLLYDLLNTFLFGGAMDTIYWMIYRIEWMINSVILVVGWIIVSGILYKKFHK